MMMISITRSKQEITLNFFPYQNQDNTKDWICLAKMLRLDLTAAVINRFISCFVSSSETQKTREIQQRKCLFVVRNIIFSEPDPLLLIKTEFYGKGKGQIPIESLKYENFPKITLYYPVLLQQSKPLPSLLAEKRQVVLRSQEQDIVGFSSEFTSLPE